MLTCPICGNYARTDLSISDAMASESHHPNCLLHPACPEDRKRGWSREALIRLCRGLVDQVQEARQRGYVAGITDMVMEQQRLLSDSIDALLEGDQ